MSKEDYGFDVPEQAASTAPRTPKQAARVTTAPPPAMAFASFKEAIDELQRVEALPERNASEERAKARELSAIRKIVFELQQGLPVVEVTADAIAQAAEASRDENKRLKLERLAREVPELQELLAEFDALKKGAKKK